MSGSQPAPVPPAPIWPAPIWPAPIWPAPIWTDEHGPQDGPLVALVHGSMDRAAGLLRLTRVLDERCRVLRYDRRGYGRSIPHEHGHPQPHPGPFGMDAQVADLVALLAGRRAVVVGHSYGGNVALALADRHPELVRAVAVYESPLSWEPGWSGTTGRGRASERPQEPADAAEAFMRRMIGDAHWEELPERTRATRRREGSAMVGELGDLAAHRPWSAARIRVPVRCGYGEHGSVHHRDGMLRAASTIRDVGGDAVVVELPGCRHDAPNSHPALFARELVAPLLP